MYITDNRAGTPTPATPTATTPPAAPPHAGDLHARRVAPPFGAGNAPQGAGGHGSQPPPVDATAWRAMLAHVRQHHGALHRAWFADLRGRLLTGGMIQVLVPTLAQLDFCQSHLVEPFTAAAQVVTGRLIAVSFHCESLPRGGVYNEGDDRLRLNPDYTFEGFVTGPCNRLGHAASLAVSEQPGKAYNPLFIHGAVGLGKTHLLQATCQKLLQVQPDARILYLSCDSFVNQFIDTVRGGDMSGFRNRYRNVDVLMVDDIHFLSGHDRTQEEFFHTFNALYQQNKQIVLSADCSPSEIPELEDRLISRFNWGLVAKVDKPCYETRVAILRNKAQVRGLEVPDDVVCYVAARVDSNTRQLEGAVTTLQGTAMAEGQPITLELAKRVLGETTERIERRITIQQIIESVTAFYNVKVSDLQGRKRNASIAFPRQVCMYLARKHTPYSLEEIGGYFGGRDHTTVLHGVRTVEARSQVDGDVAAQLAQVQGKLAS